MEKELMKKWNNGNDNGQGWAIGDDNMTPTEAALEHGLVDVHDIDCEGNVVGMDDDGNLVVVCDSHGPWAVTI